MFYALNFNNFFGGEPEKKAGDESTVDWVARSLTANNMDFVDPIWFFERKLPEESHRPLRG